MSKKQHGPAKPKERFLYLAVTPDIYELPLAVADSPMQLGQMVGKSSLLIRTSICHKKGGGRIGMKFVKVAI